MQEDKAGRLSSQDQRGSIDGAREQARRATERPRRTFVAARTDGFGERLRAMVNALRLAEATGDRFAFAWRRMPRGEAAYHDVLPATETFDGAFIAASLPPKGRMVDLADLAEPILRGEPGDEIVRVGQDLPVPLQQAMVSRGDMARAFSRIGFSPPLKAAQRFADAAPLSDGTPAIHLRAGDLVYGRYRFSTRFDSKLVPLPLAIRLIDDFNARGVRPLIFGQDPALLDWLKHRGHVDLAADVLNGMALSPPQAALAELCLMGRCSPIIAGQSGFAILAAALSDQAPVTPATDMDALALIEAWMDDDHDARISALQKAATVRIAIGVANGAVNPDRELRLARQALAFDPVNPVYVLHSACLLFRMGRSAEAEAQLANQMRGEPAKRLLAQLLSPPRFTTAPYLPELRAAADAGNQNAARCTRLVEQAFANHRVAEIIVFVLPTGDFDRALSVVTWLHKITGNSLRLRPAFANATLAPSQHAGP